MNVKIQSITPEFARKILKVAEDRIAKGELRQRRLDDMTVNKYAQDMRAGHWLVNNQGIGFDAKGNLIDGRHRLWAVTKCGKPIKMLVIYGLTDTSNGTTIKAVDTIDCGRQRNLGQQLQIDGVTNSNLMAAACRTIAIAVTGRQDQRMSTSMAKGILSLYGKDMERVFQLMHRNVKITRGFFLGMVGMWHSVHPVKAASFVTDYVDMAGLPKGSPIIALKKYFDTHYRRQQFISVQVTCNAIEVYNSNELVQIIKPSESAVKWLVKIQGERAEAVLKILGKNEEPSKSVTK